MSYRLALTLADTDRLAFLALTAALDLRPGPGGSRLSDYAETDRVYREPLRRWAERTVAPDPLTLSLYDQITVAALYPSSQIVLHTDAPIRGRRLHLPLQTNDGCWSVSDGVWQQLQVGFGYWLDPTRPHGAVNWGTEVRLHLVVDLP